MPAPARPHTDRLFRCDVPADWVDRSIVVWSAPPGAAVVPPNVVVTTDRPGAGEALGVYVTRQTAQLSGTLQGFELSLRRELTFGGRPAVELVFRWAAGPGGMQQRQIFSLLPDGRVASVACTAAADDFAAADATFGAVLSSFRWTV